MPLVASHIDYALKQIKNSDINNVVISKLIFGSILPDIRYITGQDRLITHPAVTDTNFIQTIQDQNSVLNGGYESLPIAVGTTFHCFLDYWWRQQIFIPSASKYISLAIQLIDEETAFSNIDRHQIITYLSDRKSSVLCPNYPESDINKFVSLITNYLSDTSFEIKKLVRLIAQGKKFRPSDVDEILDLVDNLKRDIDTTRQIDQIRLNGVPKSITNNILDVLVQQTEL